MKQWGNVIQQLTQLCTNCDSLTTKRLQVTGGMPFLVQQAIAQTRAKTANDGLYVNAIIVISDTLHRHVQRLQTTDSLCQCNHCHQWQTSATTLSFIQQSELTLDSSSETTGQRQLDVAMSYNTGTPDRLCRPAFVQQRTFRSDHSATDLERPHRLTVT